MSGEGSVLKGVITHEGLQQSIIAAESEGWYIYPTGFGISDVLGEISATRNMLNLNPMWYEAPISGRIVKDVSTIEFTCNIPPAVIGEQKGIKELYIFAQNEEGNNFLLAILGIEGDAIYDPGGSFILRTHISIQNLDLRNLYVFKYTQAMEIEEHNNDPNAHPDIQKRLEYIENFCCGGSGGSGNVSGASLLYYGNLW